MTEIFRHLRSHWFNSKTCVVEPLRNGGISFLLHLRAAEAYDFWIYICPEDTQFSSRQAVKSLREIVSRGTIPWGTINLVDGLLLDQLTKFIINEQCHVLASDVGHLALKIVIKNSYATTLAANIKSEFSESRKHYE